MTAFDIYKSRLNSYGTDQKDAFINGAVNSIVNAFSQSPFAQSILINNVEYEVILNEGNSENEKKLLLRPRTYIDMGSIAVINSDNYLVVDFKKHELYPSGTLKLCNSTYTLTSQSTQTIVGYDYRGAPIYETTEGETTEVPCIVENQVYMGDSNQPINLPDGRLKVTLPYTEHEQLEVGQSFTMYGEDYTIQNIDKTKSINGVGLLVITGERSN